MSTFSHSKDRTNIHTQTYRERETYTQQAHTDREREGHNRHNKQTETDFNVCPSDPSFIIHEGECLNAKQH